ncbi:hypothetical protein [Streptomyces sp. NPDC020951]|uniref:hypothetical protein n=1 Tax=Streptomyces sp. NPDC020951 TaxID=3365104 RepID=UPI0037B0A0D8
MNVFEECLTDGEFTERWRPVVERLAERAHEWPMVTPTPEDFWVWDPIECPESKETGGLLIWTDLVCRTGNSVGVTLGAQVDRVGLRCGSLSSHCPGAAGELDDFTLVVPVAEGRSLSDVADALLDWFVIESQRWDQFQKRLAED